MNDELLDIIELIQTLTDEREPILAYPDAAPADAEAPFAVYRISGNEELETLDDNVGGAGYLVQALCVGRDQLEALEQADNLQKRLEGQQVAPSGASVRVDFDSVRSLGAERVSDADDELFQYQVDFTFYPGD